MKLNILYSWQSDLPNNKNRTFIEQCIIKSCKNVSDKISEISAISIESDSRGESGTPDLIDAIFSKIDICDIFICDISIINSGSDKRKVPNPNVLIELGYAAKRLGWNNIICLFNKEFANVEDLPFDIRSRKPLIYNTYEGISNEKGKVISILERNIEDIFNALISNKKYYAYTKRTIDLGMQAILLDFGKLFFSNFGNVEQINYHRVLSSTFSDIEGYVDGLELLGFHLFRNIGLNIDEFTEFIKDEVNSFFLSDSEKKILVKLIYNLREYKEFLNGNNLDEIKVNVSNYSLASAYEMNKSNSPNSYLLLETIDNEKAIVRGGGEFYKGQLGSLLNSYKFSNKYIGIYSRITGTIISLINDWIKETGDYFIVNPKTLKSI
jgi:hypothetical protein